MSTDRWRVLSEWHNAWLVADADGRRQLQRQLAVDHPALATEADRLAAASVGLSGFLEVPTLALVGRDLAEDDPPLSVGTMVGRYRIGSLIACGGMGDVYRATDDRLGRDVALKMRHADSTDPRRVERFLQEARVTASLDHPNIVRLYDTGDFRRRPYLVTELLTGETLRAAIERGPLPSRAACRITADVATGLAAAHAVGLVHRDLKPENIFLARSGETKILDFGIAKLAANDHAGEGLSTRTGVLLGTTGYLAPEQVTGDSVDGRTDLFALGSILFEMLTGQRAFVRAHTIDALHAIVHEAPPDLLAGAALCPSDTRLLPEINPINLVPHIRAPILLRQGRYDEDSHVKTQAEPLYRLLPEPKRMLFYEGGHSPAPEFYVPAITR
ncbi:MAG: serine/threonine-protein kinase [Acidobacteriota bacterium]